MWTWANSSSALGLKPLTTWYGCDISYIPTIGTVTDTTVIHSLSPILIALLFLPQELDLVNITESLTEDGSVLSNEMPSLPFKFLTASLPPPGFHFNQCPVLLCLPCSHWQPPVGVSLHDEYEPSEVVSGAACTESHYEVTLPAGNILRGSDGREERSSQRR